jgi:hypothetical protein
MRSYIEILRKIKSRELPEVIDQHCGIDFAHFKELVDSGLIQATHINTLVNPRFINSKITIAGENLLHEKTKIEDPWWKSMDRRLVIFGLVISIISIWVAIIKS